ncbi:hypothetical protein ES332_A02G147600v1 [Gossypium tomentosum]|nr:hypothetical protein ES332_A02G147600v1 [Gossypium tomentosum]
MTLMPLMVRTLARLVTALVTQPAASFTTMLYYSHLLPRNLNLERLVRPQLLHPEN